MLNKVNMLAFWTIQDLSHLKYFYEETLRGAIRAQVENRHPDELAGITPEEISLAEEKIRLGLRELGYGN